jgi:pseudoazurin
MNRFSIRTCLALALMTLCSMVAAEEHRVKMLNQGEDGSMVFEPGFLKVSPGDTVTFIAEDPAHNSVSRLTPEGADGWKGEMNEEISVTLNTEGVYLYQCDPHLALGMVGVIQVGSAGNLSAAREKADTMEKSIAINQGRLGQYLDRVEQ